MWAPAMCRLSVTRRKPLPQGGTRVRGGASKRKPDGSRWRGHVVRPKTFLARQSGIVGLGGREREQGDRGTRQEQRKSGSMKQDGGPRHASGATREETSSERARKKEHAWKVRGIPPSAPISVHVFSHKCRPTSRPTSERSPRSVPVPSVSLQQLGFSCGGRPGKCEARSRNASKKSCLVM